MSKTVKSMLVITGMSRAEILAGSGKVRLENGRLAAEGVEPLGFVWVKVSAVRRK